MDIEARVIVFNSDVQKVFPGKMLKHEDLSVLEDELTEELVQTADAMLPEAIRRIVEDRFTLIDVEKDRMREPQAEIKHLQDPLQAYREQFREDFKRIWGWDTTMTDEDIDQHILGMQEVRKSRASKAK